MGRREEGGSPRHPRVSVVLPIHDRANVLGRAIHSVLAQTDDDWELVIVDDGSSDEPETVLMQFKDPRIRLIRHSENRGAPAARNTGMEAARGGLIAFLDSDDVWRHNRLAAQSTDFETSRAGAMVCGVQVITMDGTRLGTPTLGDDPVARLANFESGVIHTSALMIKKSVVEQGIRFDERLPAYQEYDLLLQIARRGLGVAGVADVLVEVRYDDHGQHISNPAAQVKALELIGDKYLGSMTGRGRGTYHLKLMRAHIRLGDIDAARRDSRRAIAAQPLAAKRWPIAVGSLFGDKAFAGVYRIYSTLASPRW